MEGFGSTSSSSSSNREAARFVVGDDVQAIPQDACQVTIFLYQLQLTCRT
jgi:hypothetical protein